MLRAMVVDDEPLAVERMCSLLARVADVEVTQTATNGRDALARIVGGDLNLLFLDVEMPQIDGFDLIEELARRTEVVPFIVLVTAHEYHAPMAFDSGVVDFLTKPVRLGRLETAVARVVRMIRQSDAATRLQEVTEQLDDLRRSMETKAADFVWVQRRGGAVRVDLRAVERVQAEGEYVRLFVDGADYLHRETLTALAARLDPARFVRIHRSSVVETDTIVGVRRRATGSYQALLRDGSILPVGRSYRAVIRSLISRLA